MRIQGRDAQSTAKSIEDPAFYAVLIEKRDGQSVATLPFELCSQSNGSLLPTSLFGDNED